MKDEIKEIIDRLERIDHKEYIAFEFADSATFNEMARCFEERKKMADYITNLQETKINMEQELQELYLIKDNLQEENKMLKKTKDYANDEVVSYCNTTIDLQQRIDKALDYIKNEPYNLYDEDDDIESCGKYFENEQYDNLLNILEGDKD